MNTQSFSQRVKRTVLAAGKCFLIITAFLSSAASAQSGQEVDLSVGVVPVAYSFVEGSGEVLFQSGVSIHRDRALDRVTATGVTISVELPDGAVPTVRDEDSDKCNFADNILTCELGDIASGAPDARPFTFKVKPLDGARTITLTLRVTANEFDPNVNNNTLTRTFFTTRMNPRKRARVF